jgi:hypothetical protein
VKAFLDIVRRVKGRVGRALFKYRLPRRPFSYLSRHSVEPVRMLADALSASRPTEDLYHAWRQIPGGHKWWHYFEIYERVLGPLRSRQIRLLEIGVYHGASVAMWRAYLHPQSIIVGLDIDPRCAAFDRPDERVHVRVGDQSDPLFLQRVVDEFGPFDVVIDDGSHVCSHMIKSFDFLFLRGMTNDGIYIAEDTHANFWPGYRDQRYSFVDLCKDLVDLTHAHYVANVGVIPFTLGQDRRVSDALMTRIGAQISEIRFLDSVIVLQRRSSRPLPTIEHL